MDNLDQRTLSRLDMALDGVCRRLSASGGDHESRRYIAEHLIKAARAGKTDLEDLRVAAEIALRYLTVRRSA